MIEVIKPGIELLTKPIQFHYQLQTIEAAGRTCYQSEAKSKRPEVFIKKILKLGHESVIEHGAATIRFVIDRSASHQLVRHRIGAYCLSGDTVVPSFSKKGRSPKRWTIKQLYDWSKDSKRSGRIKLINLRSLDENNILQPNKINSIIYSGKQNVFEIETKCGRKIKATSNHQVLTSNGWQTVKQLNVGDLLVANGTVAYKDPDWIREMYFRRNMMRKDVARLAGVSDTTMGKWIRLFGLQKPKCKYPNRKPGHGQKGMHSDAAKLAISERMMRENNHRWKGDDVGRTGAYYRTLKKFHSGEEFCWSCKSTENLHRHHLDHDVRNIDKSNVRFLCAKCHSGWHNGVASTTVFNTEIVSIELVGLEDTYDIEMKSPYHNFVANGLVVHNSQESQRYCNYNRKDELIVIRNVSFDPYEHTRAYVDWCQAIKHAYSHYQECVENGVKPEDTRSILPNAVKTEVVTTYNFRVWRHVIRERALNPRAQWQIRAVMQLALQVLHEHIPCIFGDLMTELEQTPKIDLRHLATFYRVCVEDGYRSLQEVTS